MVGSVANGRTQGLSRRLATSWPCGKADSALPGLLISFSQIKLEISILGSKTLTFSMLATNLYSMLNLLPFS